MSKVASAAATMGVGEDQLAAQLSTIISVTRQAPQTIGTSLKTVYARIADIKAGVAEDGTTLGRYSGKMAELGFNVLDTNNNLRDMGEVIQEIGHKWDTLTREQQVYLAQTMAGQRQYSRMMALFDNFDEYEKALQTARNAEGTLQEQQDTYMESTQAHLKQLRATLEEVYNSLADRGFINDFIDSLSVGVNIIGNFVQALDGGIGLLKILGAVGLDVFSKQISKSINTTINNFELARQKTEQVKAALDLLREVQNNNLGDDYTQSFFAQKESVLEMAPRLDNQQIETFQRMTSEISALSAEENKLTIQNEAVEKALQEMESIVIQNVDSWEQLDFILGNSAGYEELSFGLESIKERLEESENEIVDFGKQWQKVQNELRQTGGNIGAEQISESLNKLKESVLNFPINEIEISEKFREEFQTIRTQFANLGNNLPTEPLLEKVKDLFIRMKADVSTQTQAIQELLNNFSPQQIKTLEETLDRVRDKLFNTEKGLNGLVNNFSRQMHIETITKTVSGLGEVAFGIQQIQHLGSIWKNSDLSGSQKLLQTIINISFSLPMVTKGIGSLAKTFGVFSAAQEAATAAGLAEKAALEAQTTALSAEAMATRIAKVEQEAFNRAILLNPFTLIITVITAAITAWSIYTQHVKQAREQQIKNNNEEIEKANKIIEQTQRTKDLLKSLEELKEKQQEGNSTRSETLQTIEDLIEQYNLQGAAADRLRSNYNNLSQAIHEVRKAAADQEAKSAEETMNLLQENLRLNFESLQATVSGGKYNKFKDFQNSLNKNNKEQFRVSLGYLDEDDLAKLQDKGLKIINDKSEQTNMAPSYALEIKNTSSELKRNYDIIKQLMASNQKNDFNNTVRKSFLNILKENEENMKLLEETEKKLTESQVTQLDVDFSNISSLDQYQNTLNELISKIQGLGKSKKQADELAENYINQYFNQTFIKYDQISKYVDNIQENIKENIPEDIKKTIKGLDDNQLSELLSISPGTFESYQQLRIILNKIANTDFSNMDQLKEDPQALLKSAAETYNIYKNIQNQVKDGKTISKKQYQDYIQAKPQLSQFFTTMANGSYKMVGNAEQFKKVIESIQFKGFYEAINAAGEKLGKLLDLQKIINSRNFDFENLRGSAAKSSGPEFAYMNPTTIDYEKAQNQLDYLMSESDLGSELETKVKQWQELVDKKDLPIVAAGDIAKAIEQIGNKTGTLNQDVKRLKETAIEAANQLHDAIMPLDQDIDTKTLQILTQRIMNTAESSQYLDDALTNNKEAAEDLAVSILRYDDAIQTTVDNYEEWIQVLNSGNIAAQAAIIDDLKETYADFLDVSEDVISDSFAFDPSNLKDMKAALDGDLQAYERLVNKVNTTLIQATFNLNTEEAQNKFNEFLEEINSFKFENGDTIADLQVGVDIDDEKFYKKLDKIINEAQMSVGQAEALLDSLNIDADVIPDTTVTQETIQNQYQYFTPPVHSIRRIPIGLQDQGYEYAEIFIPPGGQPKAQTVTSTQTIPNINGKLHVQRASKKSSSNSPKSIGATKFNMSNQGGGPGGTKRRADQAQKKKKEEEAARKKAEQERKANTDESTKDTKKYLEDERDIYHDINIQIEKVNRNLNRAQKQQDRLYGKQLLDNLNKQTKILEQHKNLLKSKLALQKQDLANQRGILSGLGVAFDQYGNISNYMSVLGQKQSYINSLISQYNGLINTFNSSTDKQFKEDLSNRIEMLNQQIQNAQDDLKNTQSRINEYDTLRQSIEDVKDEIEEETQKQFEINIKKFRMQVEIRLEMGQAERDWNQFKRKVLQHTDLIKDTDFSRIFKDAKQSFADMSTYFNVRGTKGSLATLTKQLYNTRAEIEKIDKTGKSAIYGDNKKQAMEDLQSDLKQLMSEMENIQQLIDAIDKAYLDTIEDVQTHFDDQIESYEYISDLLQHDMDLLTLIYGEKNYQAMDNYYKTLNKNQLEEIDALKRQGAFWKQQWDMALRQKDIAAAKEFEENYRKTIKNLNDLIKDSVQTLKDKYNNGIDSIINNLNNKITNGKGLDYVDMQWKLLNKNADEYLDTVNAAYNIQKLETQFKQTLNETKSIKNQRQLKKLMDQQLSNLRSKDKLSQYDIDRAEKLLDIERARIALEDIRANKTTMRLKRDSQGNYSYEFTADQDKTLEAQQNLSDTQNNLYNFDLDERKKDLDEFYQAYKEMLDKIKEIRNMDWEDDNQRIEAEKLVREQYMDYLLGKSEQVQQDNVNLIESAFINIENLYDQDATAYEDMTAREIDSLMQDLVPTWDSGIQQMTDKMVAGEGFIPEVESAFEDLDDLTRDYEDELDRLADTAGIDLGDIQNGIDDVADELSDLIDDNEDLIDTMDRQIDKIRDVRDAAKDLVDEYNNVYTAAMSAVSAIQSYIQAQRASAAAAASSYSNPNSYGGSSGYSSGGYSSSGNYSSNGSSTPVRSGYSSGGDGVPSVGDRVKFVSGSYYNDSYGSSPLGSQYRGSYVYITKLASGHPLSVHIGTQPHMGWNSDLGWVRRSQISGYDTGGYTGDWKDNSGKLAFLHQKELVLNAKDTQNILDSVKILRAVIGSLDGNISSKLADIKFTNQNSKVSSDILEQKVHIDASFPNVNSKKEIEEAFNDLLNLAAQRIMRRK